ncbi:DUF2797 domain-containing protein [Candidatus Shikimatogenerans bostrichidophilus]
MKIFYPFLCSSNKNNNNKINNFEFKNHIVYLSFTSNFKIGVTIKSNFINRLMDQGAIKAIIIAYTPNRYIAGVIEQIVKRYISDKTNFRIMLTNKFKKNLNILKIKDKIINILIKNNYSKYIFNNKKIFYFYYPIIKYPKIINIIKLNKIKYITLKLKGIKGQYLIFNNNYVLNIINHIGFILNIYIY